MKKLFLRLLPGLLLCACGGSLVDPVYTLALPELPSGWREMLGTPRWRIEWINPGGVKESRTGAAGGEIALPQTWASPVSAWPYWPGRNIGPGIFRPAGAIFPFDASGDTISLSWQGGVDAVFYWELGAAAAAHAAGAAAQTAVLRPPRNFNWPRFRELFDDPAFAAKFHADPWTVDWKTVAAQTVSPGFDKRRIVGEARTAVPIPVSPGPWIGTSPFVPPLLFGEGETPVFPAGTRPGSWFSPGAVLRCTTETWILIPL
jgi:hypothetical protein